MRILIALLALLAALVGACDDDDDGPDAAGPNSSDGAASGTREATVAATERPSDATTALADVVEVSVSGEPGAYSFVVAVRSSDSGCDRYADWWEVLTTEGALLHRRVLLHSHVDEQPFSRSGGPIPASPTQELLVRAHMNQGGYGGVVLRGTPVDGFEAIELPAGFAADLESVPPLPEDCAF